MANVVINVDGMSCEHCVRAVENATGALPSVSGVVVDLEAKTVTLDFDSQQISLDRIKSAIEDEGYEVIDPQLVSLSHIKYTIEKATI